MTEIPFIQAEQKFIRGIVQVHTERVIKIQFYQSQRIVATRRLPDRIREIRRAQGMPVDVFRVHHFPAAVEYLVIIGSEVPAVSFDDG